MKKHVALILAICFCFSLAACGASAASSAPTPAPAAEQPASTPAPTPAPTAEPAPESLDLQPLVDSLNEEEVSQRTDDDPSIGVFELGKDKNTIVYKFAMHIFQYVIMMAEAGDAENMNAYNRLIESLPSLEVSLENALRESTPEVDVLVIMMTDEYSDEATAVVDNGEIIYDKVNAVGDAPTGITPILEAEELPPEVQAQLDEFENALTSGDNAG